MTTECRQAGAQPLEESLDRQHCKKEKSGAKGPLHYAQAIALVAPLPCDQEEHKATRCGQ